MRILVTGSDGFIGRNLVVTLKSLKHTVFTFDRNNTLEELEIMSESCEFVVHLAGVNRTSEPNDFYEGNQQSVDFLIRALQKNHNKAPILLSSSIQAELNNDYGRSKRAGEQVLLNHAEENNSPVYIYRFSNLFGKWSKPNYNTVIATWCYNISRGLPININDEKHTLNLMYIDDVVQEIINAINKKPNNVDGVYYSVPVSYTQTLGEIQEMLLKFKKSRENLYIPDMSPGFETKLYSTYLSFLPEDSFSYPLKMSVDGRGSFTEFLKTDNAGQVSINISKPGITKGQHWHHSKNEKFLVVSGEGVIQFRNIFSNEVIEYHVTGSKLEVIDIPPGYTHNIINLGTSDLVTVMWVNEPFDPEHADTFYEEV